jgi:selenophosphate synthase
VRFDEGIPEDQQVLCFSPETSGGLLLAVHPDRVDQVLGQVQPAWVVGEVVAADAPHIEVLID